MITVIKVQKLQVHVMGFSWNVKIYKPNERVESQIKIKIKIRWVTNFENIEVSNSITAGLFKRWPWVSYVWEILCADYYSRIRCLLNLKESSLNKSYKMS